MTSLVHDSITGEMDLGDDHWVYAVHLPGDSVFPGCLLVEAAGQLVALWAWANGQRGKPRYARVSARFQSEVRPSDSRLTLHGKVHRKRNLNFGTVTIFERSREVAAIEVVLAVIGEPGAVTPNQA